MHAHPSTAPAEIKGPIEWTEAEKAEIEQIVARYPTRRSATLPVLWKAQRKFGWLSLDVLRLCARTLELPPSDVLAVASFYTMLKRQPTGKYLIQVCHTLSCALGGADQIVSHLKKTLNISEGETSADGQFTLMRVECLASCGSAPMMQINDEFYERLDPVRVDRIIDDLKSGKPMAREPEVDEWHWSNES